MSRFLQSLVLGAVLVAAGHGQAADGPFLVTRLAPDLILLGSDQGTYSNNSLVFTGPEGVLLVDTQADADAAALHAYVEGLGLGAPKYIVTTHGHVEHMGGAASFGAGPVVIAHESLPDRLRSGTYLFAEYPPEAHPDVTVADTLTLRFNGEVIRITDIGGAHDDHELMVHFTRHGVAHTSSVVNGFNFPSVDSAGDALAFAATARRVAGLLPPGTRIVSGHHGRAAGFGATGTWEQLEPYARMMDDCLRIVRAGLAAGRTVEQMQEARVLREYSDYAGSYVDEDGWIATLAGAIGKQAPERRDICVPVFAAWKEKGAAAATKLFARLLDDEPDAWDGDEIRLLGIATRLAARDLHADAIAFLAFARERYRDGDYAYYGELALARSLHALGRDDEAAAHARRSLEARPGFAAAATLLAELTGDAAHQE